MKTSILSPQHFPKLMLSSAIALACQGHAFAEESKNASEETITLSQVTIEDSATQPAHVVIDSEDLERRQASDIADIFKREPSVEVGGGPRAAAQKTYVRGIEDTNLNVTVDGAMQPGYIYHHQGRISLEPEMIKQVEVEAGTGVATAGAGALAGAIRYTTKDAKDLLLPDQNIGSYVKGRYYSNTKGYKATASIYGKAGQNFSALGSYSYTDHGNYTDGHGDEVQDTEQEINSYFLKFNGDFESGHHMSLSVDHQDDNGKRPIRPHMISAGWNGPVEQEYEKDNATFNYRYDAGNPMLKLKSTLYYNDAYVKIHNAGVGDFVGGGVETIGLDLRNTSTWSKISVTYGADYRNDRGYAINPSPEYGQLNDDRLDVIGAYAQAHYMFVPMWTLDFGARADSYDLKDVDDQSFSSTGISPNISLTFAPGNGLEIYGSYSQAHRGVGVREAYLIGYPGGRRTVYDADLEAEEAQNREVGVRFAKGGFFTSGEVFQQDIDNFIYYGSNIGDADVFGYAARIGYDWTQVSTSLGVSYNEPNIKDKTTGETSPISDGDMSLGAPTGRTWVAAVDYFMPLWDVSMGWTGRFVEKLTHVAEGTPEKPAYNVQDVYVAWAPMHYINVKLAVNNLFDQAYYDHSSFGYSGRFDEVIGLPAAGRDIRVEFTARY